MRAIGLMLALGLTVGLAGCGKPETPLSHAIDAFRAGDQNALTAAHQEADEALKTAVQPDSDMCMLEGEDIRKYSEAARIAKLDNGEVLRQPEEERLLYALKIAGLSPKITDDPRLKNSPLYRAMNDWTAMRNCKNLPDSRVKLDDESIRKVDAANDTEIARTDALKGWMADLRQRDGADFESRMRSAANHLSDVGYSAPWPARTEFYGEDAPGTFQEVQDRLRARDAEDAFRDKDKTTFEEMQDRMRRQRN
jgi:hypothetical protein